MDLYTKTAYEASKIVTNRYSTSFSLSIRLFDTPLRPHIYAIYGLVRIGDEIVDTYKGDDAAELLQELKNDTHRALKTGYSTNPIVHAFATTARQYMIGADLIDPFFISMAMDLKSQTYTQEKYEKYIYGSAEVVGLMCLKVFCNDEARYESLVSGARSLGAAYQKVNFLRDIAADTEGLERWYFPEGSYETFDEAQKKAIETDIAKDFAGARRAIDNLPESSQKAVRLSWEYYHELMKKIEATSAEHLKKRRVRVPDIKKMTLLAKTLLKGNRT
jgi:15-cis-phytoene synthase